MYREVTEGCGCPAPSPYPYFTAEELGNYANVMIWALKNARQFNGNGQMENGDIIRILYEAPALPLIEEIYLRCLRNGWNPVVSIIPSPKMQKDFFNEANQDQLKWMAPWIVPPQVDGQWVNEFGQTVAEAIKGYIYIFAPEDLHHLEGVDAKKIAMSASAKKPYRDYLDPREKDGDFGWALAMMPTLALADEAGQSLQEYTREVIRACFLDLDNPSAEWQHLYENSKKVCEFLTNLPVDYYHIESYDGQTNMTIKAGEKRKWVGCSGHNIPSYENFTTPDCRGTQGRFYADKTSLRDGNLVKGVRLVFEDGKVTHATAEEGEEYLLSQLDMDEGARMVGEFSLTDRRFSKIEKFMANTLYDENVGGAHGNMHIALGRGFPSMIHTGEENLTKEQQKELGYCDSALHWDIVSGAKKTVDAILKDGTTLRIYDGIFYTETD
jgi:aminopeptidase